MFLLLFANASNFDLSKILLYGENLELYRYLYVSDPCLPGQQFDGTACFPCKKIYVKAYIVQK